MNLASRDLLGSNESLFPLVDVAASQTAKMLYEMIGIVSPPPLISLSHLPNSEDAFADSARFYPYRSDPATSPR